MTHRPSIRETLTTLATLIYSLTVLIIGAILIWFSIDNDWWEHCHLLWFDGRTLQAVIHHIGTLVIATVPITLYWEVVSRRKFLDEILAKARIAKELEDAGVVHVYETFQQVTNWGELFASSHKLDIFFYSGHSWRSFHHDQLRTFLDKSYSRLRVVLPDPEDDGIVSELARQFNSTPQKVRDSIRESFDDFVGLAPGGRKVEIYYFKGMTPNLSFYRFEDTTVFSPYNHDKNRSSVPAFIVRSPGFLYRYLRHEFDVIKDQSRPVFPVPPVKESQDKGM